jgi:hypothetical protein
MLKQKLQADQITAMKARDMVRLDTLRYILSQIKNREIDTQTELTDSQVVDTMRKEVKKLQDSILAFNNGGRVDLATEYDAQKKIIQEYLPQEMSDNELKSEIQKIIDEHKDLFAQNANAMIGVCIKELKDKVDPSRIAAIVRSLS